MRARIGDLLDEWSISIDEPQGPLYPITLRGPEDGQADARTIEVTGTSDEERSRELASVLALIIESRQETGPADPGTTGDGDQPKKQPPNLPRGFVAAEAHLELGPPRDPDLSLGAGLGAGVWVLRDILQPRLRLRWTHSWNDDLRVHGVSAGLGLAAGLPLGRLWVGALAMPSFKWTHAMDTKAGTAYSGGGEATAMVQYRMRHVVFGLRTGVETTFRPVRIRGSNDVIRWGPVRWLLVLEVGLGI
ncbi:MAG: hypothetical protein KC431_11200 [Myxococcales bacterium]|nr:hypothetical protein [Myxococcales bacterium]